MNNFIYKFKRYFLDICNHQDIMKIMRQKNERVGTPMVANGLENRGGLNRRGFDSFTYRHKGDLSSMVNSAGCNPVRKAGGSNPPSPTIFKRASIPIGRGTRLKPLPVRVRIPPCSPLWERSPIGRGTRFKTLML